MSRLLVVLICTFKIVASDVTDCWPGYRRDGNWSVVAVESRLCSESWCLPVSLISADPRLGNATFGRILRRRPTYQQLVECAFYNMSNLEIIDGSESRLIGIASGALAYLPRLKYLYLPFNSISLLRSGIVFDAPNLEVLDLSWNLLENVESEAFSDMNLKVLNLSHNHLTYFKLERDLVNLEVLILSYNSLKNLENSKVKGVPFLPRTMSVLDLSFNELGQQPELRCPSGSSCTIKLVDLTKNFLTHFIANYLSNIEIEELRLAYNILRSNLGITPLFNIQPKHFPVKRISIYPNPWTCQSGITSSLKVLSNFNVTVLPPEIDTRFNFSSDCPVCVVDELEARNRYRDSVASFILHKGASCKLDKQCSGDMLCRTGTCWNPCQHRACRSSTEICEVENYRIYCSCPEGKLKNPFLYSSRCYNVECFEDSDCEDGLHCKYHICE